MKRMVGICLGMVMGCAALCSAAGAASVRLTYANFPPAATFPCIQMERWVEQVTSLTDGAVRIDTFPGGTLLGAKNMIDGVIAGQADIGCLCMAYQPGRFAITNAVSLPLGIPDARVGSLALLDLYEKYLPPAFDKVKVLAMFTCAPSNIMSRTPVRSLADLRGMDLRASGGAASILKLWGANQVGMPMSAVPEALQKGVVQGLFSSLEVLKDLDFARSCRFVTMTETVVYPFAVVMNRARWDRLPPQVQQVMQDLMRPHSEWTGSYADQHVRAAIAWSKQQYDMTFITLPPEQAAAWNKPLEAVTSTWIGSVAETLDGAAIVQSIRESVAAHAR